MIRLSYDLHIHSCLSPCGDDDMTPSNIVGMAALKGLDVIALTDHSSCKNCPAFIKLAESYGVIALAGMELTTAEEVHVVCLFGELEQALEWDRYVYEKLPNFPNSEKIFGKQQILDENDNIIGTEPKLLINATEISFDEVYGLLESYGGVMLPAHIDKSANSLIANLGFIPPDSRFTCAEVKHTGFLDRLLAEHPYLNKCNILTDSDAHYLGDISEPVNFITAASKSHADILKAISSLNGIIAKEGEYVI